MPRETIDTQQANVANVETASAEVSPLVEVTTSNDPGKTSVNENPQMTQSSIRNVRRRPVKPVKPVKTMRGIWNWWFKKPPPSNDMEELQLRLIEEGKLGYDEYEVLRLVKYGDLPFDEYQELIADKDNARSRYVKFVIQVIVSAGVTIFCMTMISVRTGLDNDQKVEGIYLPIISGILGYWLPNPDYSNLIPKKIAAKKVKPPDAAKDP